jgi:hypothetical protein
VFGTFRTTLQQHELLQVSLPSIPWSGAHVRLPPSAPEENPAL